MEVARQERIRDAATARGEAGRAHSSEPDV
jgi:hypothetical protein